MIIGEKWKQLVVKYSTDLEGLNFKQQVSVLLNIMNKEFEEKDSVEKPKRVRGPYNKRIKMDKELLSKEESQIVASNSSSSTTGVGNQNIVSALQDIDWGSDDDNVDAEVINKKRKHSDVEHIETRIVENVAEEKDGNESRHDQTKKKHKKDKHKKREKISDEQEHNLLPTTEEINEEVDEVKHKKKDKKHKKDKENHESINNNEDHNDDDGEMKFKKKKKKKHKHREEESQ